jgi:glycosyltransferase involved in cell wall biosynthesis
MSGRLRILYVIQGILPNTGPGRHLFKLMAYRNRETQDAQVFAFDQCDRPMMEALAEEHGVPSVVIGERFTTLRAYRRGWPALLRQIREYRPHVIQTHHTPIVDWAARVAGRRTRVPLNLARAVGQPKDYHTTRRGRAAWWFTRTGDAVTSPLVDYYLPNSSDVAAYLQRVEGIPARKIITVFNGIDTDDFQASPELRMHGRRQLGLRPDDQLAVMVGTLKAHKGQRYLVEAFAEVAGEFPRLHLALVGKPLSGEDEQYTDELRRFAAERGVAERLHLPADVYAHASFYEGSSNAVLEAMAMGCACIVTDVSGCPELVPDGRGGIVVPKRNAPALAAALRQVMSEAPLRAAMGRFSRERATREYGVRKMCAEIEAIARRVLGERGVRLGEG